MNCDFLPETTLVHKLFHARRNSIGPDLSLKIRMQHVRHDFRCECPMLDLISLLANHVTAALRSHARGVHSSGGDIRRPFTSPIGLRPAPAGQRHFTVEDDMRRIHFVSVVRVEGIRRILPDVRTSKSFCAKLPFEVVGGHGRYKITDWTPGHSDCSWLCVGNSRADQLEERFLEFSVSVIQLAQDLPRTPACRHISTQILRSGTASASNYGEARGAESRADFIHKLGIVHKELNETTVWLRILSKIVAENPERITAILAENQELCRIVGASLRTARASLLASEVKNHNS